MSTTGLSTLVLATLTSKTSKTLDEIMAAVNADPASLAAGSVEGYTRKAIADSLRGLKSRNRIVQPVKGRFALNIADTQGAEDAQDGRIRAKLPATAKPAQVPASLAVERVEDEADGPAPVTVVRDAVKKMRAERPASKPRKEMSFEELQASRIGKEPKTKVALSARQITFLLDIMSNADAPDAQLRKSLDTGLAHCAKLAEKKAAFAPAVKA